jgi:hypothetical protein
MAGVLSASASTPRGLQGLNVAAAGSFVLGGGLFAWGAALAELGTAGTTTVNATYLVGGVFFSLGGYLSVMMASGTLARRSAIVLFVGTLFFAVSLVGAFAQGLTPRQSDGWVWLPDITGCLCFLVSGHLAMLDVGGGRVRLRLDVVGWWVVAVNQLGSVLFFLAGIAAFTHPATGAIVNAGLVNWGTFAGASCFVAGAVIQAFDTPATTRTVGTPRHDTAE